MAADVSSLLFAQADALTLRGAADGIDAAPTLDPLAAEFMRYDAAKLEQSSIDALSLEAKPSVGTGGELVPEGDQIKRGGGNFIDTVERPDAVTATASMDRLKLADDGIGCVLLVEMAWMCFGGCTRLGRDETVGCGKRL